MAKRDSVTREDFLVADCDTDHLGPGFVMYLQTETRGRNYAYILTSDTSDLDAFLAPLIARRYQRAVVTVNLTGDHPVSMPRQIFPNGEARFTYLAPRTQQLDDEFPWEIVLAE